MTAGPFAPPLIVFVDDNRQLEATLGPLFAERGVRFASAPAGFAAHEIALRLLPEAILIGSDVADADAVLMIEQFRADAATRHTAAIVLARTANRLFMDRLLAAGASEIILEPTAPSEVFDIVHRRARLSPAGRQVLELRRRLAQSRILAHAQRTTAIAMRTRVAELFVRMQEVQMAMAAADSSGECVAVNTTACALVGRHRDDLLGRKVWDFGRPDGAAAREDAWDEFLRNGLFDSSCSLERADGTSIGIELYAATDLLPGLHVGAFEAVAVAAV